MNLAEEINEALTSLCRCYFPNNESSVTKQLRHTVSMINSPIFTRSVEDEFNVTTKIKRRLAKHNKVAAAARFADLCQQLASKKSIEKRGELLQFLFALNQHGGVSREKNNIPVVPSLNLPKLSNYDDGTRRPWAAAQFESACTSSGVSSVNTPTSITPRNYVSSQARLNVVSGRNAYDSSLAKVSEKDLLRDVIYCLQGIDGRYIRRDSKTDDFCFSSTDNISKPTKELIRKIIECGWLFTRIKSSCDSLNSAIRKGSISLAFAGAVQNEMAEYYRMLALFQAQLDQQEDQGVNACSGNGLSLRRVLALLMQPKQKLLILSSVLNACKDVRGGALISVLFSYRNNGDVDLERMVSNLLTALCRPILTLMLRWMFEGVLEDPYDEFFIICNQSAKEESMWNDKYSVNDSMLPTFIDRSAAHKILIAGKSINFFRSICKDRSLLPVLEITRKSFKEMDPGIFFNQAKCDEFYSTVDFVYTETSRNLLDSMNNNFYLFSQLEALKKYILLSQGDFARCLMDLLQEDLAKPASDVHLHNLTRHLESALRQTNAQFEKKEILKRLDVDLLEKTDGDAGWEIFMLKYWNTGPIGTVLTQHCIRSYNRLFDFIWRLKRLSFILSNVWRDNVSLKTSRGILELSPIVHSLYLLTCEIVYFVEQMQYYFLFEVLECAWVRLEANLKKAKDLDDVIASHSEYLKVLLSQSLLSGGDCSGLLDDFRTIVGLIFQFENLHKLFFAEYRREVDARVLYENSCTTKTNSGKWAATDLLEAAENSRSQRAVALIANAFKPKLAVLLDQYRRSLKHFLINLTQQDEEQFRLLSFRLDFSRFYLSQDPQLDTPLTFRRLSRRVKDVRSDLMVFE